MTRAAAACLLAAAACAPAAELPPPRAVVLVVLDAAAAAQVEAAPTPHLDALAARGRRFTRAFSNATWTLPSTVSLLTGRLQESHGVVTNRTRAPDALTLLPERFADAGFRTAAFVQMVYASDSYGLDQGFDDYRYYGFDEAGERTRTTADVLRWLDAHADEPFFLYLHFRRPHSPYDPSPLALGAEERDCPLADGSRDALLAQADSIDTSALTGAEREHARHLYRANVTTVDERLGQVLARLEDRPDVAVVVTADHGEGLGEHGFWGHGSALHAECVDVPLVVAGPGVAPGVDGAPVATVDVAPTLLAWCGLPPERDADGVPLLGRLAGRPARDERPRLLSARYTGENVPALGAIDGDWKLVLEVAGATRLFDRRADPAETRDLAAEHPDLAARLADAARALRDRAAPAAAPGPALDPRREEDLRALGYLR